MLACFLKTGYRLQKVILIEPFSRNDGCEARLAFCQGSGLIDDEGVDLLKARSSIRAESPEPDKQCHQSPT